MPSQKDFQHLTEARLKEVIVLKDKKLYNGARYLSGYVIEAALKARICKVLRDDYPEDLQAFKTHDFETLIRLSGLRSDFDQMKNNSRTFETNWSLIRKWGVADRYSLVQISDSEMDEFLKAMEDAQDGILTWIKSQW